MNCSISFSIKLISFKTIPKTYPNKSGKDERIQLLEQTNSNQQALLDGFFYMIVISEMDLDKVTKGGSIKSDNMI